MTTPFVSIWTNEDTAERGPTVDEAGADIEVTGYDDAMVLHVTSDGPHGLWTVALTIPRDQTTALALSLLSQQDVTDLREAIDRAGDDLAHLLDRDAGDYDEADKPAIVAKLDRWVTLYDQLTPQTDAERVAASLISEPIPDDPRFASLEEDPDAPDDHQVLISGVLYDARTGEEV